MLVYNNYNNTTTVLPDTDSGRGWYFAGTIVFEIGAIFTAVINIIAFIIIFRNEKCFGKNGFREQLLILCVNDTCSSLSFFMLTYCIGGTCVKNLLYGVLWVFAFFQFTSFGNTLGISLQRFVATRRVGESQAGWNRKYTAVYCCTNVIVMALLLFLYVLLAGVLNYSSTIVLLIIICLCVLLTDIFCCLTLYYLNKNMKAVAGGDAASGSRGFRDDGPSPSATQNDADKPSISFACSSYKDKEKISTDEVTSSGFVETSRYTDKVQTRSETGKMDTLSIPPIFKPSNEDLSDQALPSKRPNMSSKHKSFHRDQGNTTQQRLNRFGRYQRDAGLTVAIVVLLLNLFTFIPVMVSMVARFAPNIENLEAYRSVVMCLTINSLINPFVYVFRMKALEAKLLRTARSCLRRICNR